jgi:tetratricopeptide (TPR) repeat protein
MVERETQTARAEAAISAGNLASGIAEYRELLALDPRNPATLIRLGDLLSQAGRTQEAAEVFAGLATIYVMKGLPTKAIAIYKRIIKLDPARVATYEALADLYARQGMLTEARAQYQVLADYYTRHNDTANAVRTLDAIANLGERDQLRSMGSPSLPGAQRPRVATIDRSSLNEDERPSSMGLRVFYRMCAMACLLGIMPIAIMTWQLLPPGVYPVVIAGLPALPLLWLSTILFRRSGLRLEEFARRYPALFKITLYVVFGALAVGFLVILDHLGLL